MGRGLAGVAPGLWTGPGGVGGGLRGDAVRVGRSSAHPVGTGMSACYLSLPPMLLHNSPSPCSDAYIFFVGLLLSQWAMVGYDSRQVPTPPVSALLLPLPACTDTSGPLAYRRRPWPAGLLTDELLPLC